ncbi:MAG: MFS transporter [Hyphomonadaceae bacterium]|nr:MFS transporter [Hyphomonadaceae bacterium]
MNKLPFYRGWTIVAAGFICAVIGVGATVYSFGAIVAPVSEEFGLSRAATNSGYALFLLGMAIWSPLVGRLLDRAPARLIMLIGAASFALGFTAMALAQAPWQMGVAALTLVAFGTASGGALAANTVTARWFNRRRGRAMGILAVASSTGGFVVTPTAAYLVETTTWREAVLVVGWSGAALIAIAVLLLIRDRPSAVGLTVENVPASIDQSAAEGEPWPWRRIISNRNFWLITFGTGVLLASDQAMLASLIPYGQDLGFTLSKAAQIVAVLTASSIIGKLVIGFLADHVDKRALFIVVVICHIAFNLALVAQPSFGTLLVIASFTGLATGGVYPVWTTLTAEVFGSRSFGSIMGAMAIVMQPLAIVLISFVGQSYDNTGDYRQSFMVFAGLAVLSAILVTLVQRPKPSTSHPQ